LRNIVFTDKFPVRREMSIDLLLGEPIYSHLPVGSPVLGHLRNPGAQETKLGWSLCAADPTSTMERQVQCFAVQSEKTISLDKILTVMVKFWDLEVIGVKPPTEQTNEFTVEEQAAIDTLKAGAMFDDEKQHWKVKLP
jgi:hypothetical protein